LDDASRWCRTGRCLWPPEESGGGEALTLRELISRIVEDEVADIRKEANPGVDPWLPGAGTRLAVPQARLLPSEPREGIVVNLG